MIVGYVVEDAVDEQGHMVLPSLSLLSWCSKQPLSSRRSGSLKLSLYLLTLLLLLALCLSLPAVQRAHVLFHAFDPACAVLLSRPRQLVSFSFND